MISLISLWLIGFFVIIATISLGCRLSNYLEFTKDWKVVRDLVGFFMVDMPSLLLVLACAASVIVAAVVCIMKMLN